MAVVKLTDRGVKSLPTPNAGRTEYFDLLLPRFGLRITNTGHRSWIIVYRHKGAARRYTLNGNLSLADARKEAKSLLRRVDGGDDISAIKRRARTVETVRQIAAIFIERHCKPYKRSWKANANMLNRDVLPAFGSKKAVDVTRADVRDMLRKIVDRGSQVQSNRVLEVTRKMFNWAIAEDIGGLTVNPCTKIAKPGLEHQRTRVLTASEIKTLWSALDEIGDPLVAAAYRLLLLTGQRSVEICGARKNEIGEDGWLTIPADRVKNKTEHRMWLSALARRILAEIEPHNEGSEYLFPSPDRGHLRWFSKIHADIVRKSALVDFRKHDLRRTAASGMAAMGISRITVAKILNHSERGTVTAVYDRYSYAREIKDALDAWASKVEDIISGVSSQTEPIWRTNWGNESVVGPREQSTTGPEHQLESGDATIREPKKRRWPGDANAA